MHTPIKDATRGVVSIRNYNLFNDDDGFVIGTLTGVALDDDLVLTAAHAIMWASERDAPLTIGGRAVGYEIIADGWRGKRGGLTERSRKVSDKSYLSSDYMLIRLSEPVADHAELVILDPTRIGDVRRITLGTRMRSGGEPVAIPVRELTITRDQTLLLAEFPGWFDGTDYWMSGSPFIGEYPDGTLVLLGIVNGSGTFQLIHDDGTNESLIESVSGTPVMRIPIREATDPGRVD